MSQPGVNVIGTGDAKLPQPGAPGQDSHLRPANAATPPLAAPVPAAGGSDLPAAATAPECVAAPPPGEATPPQRLRLSTILLELVRTGSIVPASEGSSAPSSSLSIGEDEPEAEEGAAPECRRKRNRIPSNITVGEILDRTRHAGFGFLIALLAVLSMPFPGISVPFGLAIAFGALQMICGFHRPWLPQRIRRYAISIGTLAWIEKHLYRWTRGLEKLVRPRFEPLTRGPFWILCGVGVLSMAVGLALPIPIPFSNLFFIIPLLIFAIGLMENDGLVVMLGFAVTTIDILLAIWFSEYVIRAITAVIRYFGFA